MVRSRDIMVVTQRRDTFSWNVILKESLKNSSVRVLIEHVWISEPQPCLPDNEEFSDQIVLPCISCRFLEDPL